MDKVRIITSATCYPPIIVNKCKSELIFPTHMTTQTTHFQSRQILSVDQITRITGRNIGFLGTPTKNWRNSLTWKILSRFSPQISENRRHLIVAFDVKPNRGVSYKRVLIPSGETANVCWQYTTVSLHSLVSIVFLLRASDSLATGVN